MQTMPRIPENRAVDRHVGLRIRALRRALGLTQTDLAKRMYLTFQQVQKYERGINRISASALYETAAILAVPIGAFFDGLPPTGHAKDDDDMLFKFKRLVTTEHGMEMAELFPRVDDKHSRRAVVSLLRAMVGVG
jgi:transcriptional regulator with XRE-family HTH domain